MKDIFGTYSELSTKAGKILFCQLNQLEKKGIGKLDRLPFSIRVLLEMVLRNCDDQTVTQQDVVNLAQWKAYENDRVDMPFLPARVLLQDFTGVPVLVDLAAMRSAMKRLGGDPSRINPVLPVDLVVDHSVQVDYYGTNDAFQLNSELEFQRNKERYEFLHWGQKTFNNFRVVPPSTGIVHQVNLEYLAQVVVARKLGESRMMAFPDSVVGTDSHTTMINGLGVVGWGVGGIEAVAAMLGKSVEMLIPDVVGIKMIGKIQDGITPTDLTLAITQLLRKKGVVGKFVEFFGPSVESLSLADRAMVSNMSPEYGATLSYFPVDEKTLEFLRLSGRTTDHIDLVERYCKTQRLFREGDGHEVEYSDILELDLNTIEANLAGPKRPQDKVLLREMKSVFRKALIAPKSERGYALTETQLISSGELVLGNESLLLKHGAVVLAAITSCTNTSNPFVMIGAGLLAKNAVEQGLKIKPYIKTSLAPGSRVVTSYLEKAGLLNPLASLGFNLVGYGCTTCIGNSGPLLEEVVKVVEQNHLVVAAVLSGNRNFEGRVSSHTLANYLASPPLVVAYALAGTVDIDLTQDPLGVGKGGIKVYLKDIWPSSEDIMEFVEKYVSPTLYRENYESVFLGNPAWNKIDSTESALYNWSEDSTYIQEPPYFINLPRQTPKELNINGARPLVVLGDSITTDHISPAGDIPPDSPTGRYLNSLGVSKSEFNSFGSRRGNDRVMTRGTFGNIRLKNLLALGIEGGYTEFLPEKERMPIYDAAMRYKNEGIPTIVLAGKEYGTGSSRDWAAKGVLLLGVKAVIAESYERIHRSNLVGMGVLPLQYMPGENLASLGLIGREVFSIENIQRSIKPRSPVVVRAEKEDGSSILFKVIARLDTPIEIEYFFNGGILHTVLYDLISVDLNDGKIGVGENYRTGSNFTVEIPNE